MQLTLEKQLKVHPHPHQKEWDHHGSYQWTYFAEPVKQKIGFFLSKKLHGRNLDLGGGWYLTHPGSTAVDLSPVCLAYNPAEEKVQFDLETLAQGAQLPFRQHSFDSATMVSAWQYIQNTDALVKELRRVLRPGAELYIINGQGAGLSGCVRNATRSGPIAKYFHNIGFDTLVENIPCSINETNEFQSVCIAFPEINLFGEVSQIKNKQERMKEDCERVENPRAFLEENARRQVGFEIAGLSNLTKHPITKYSRDFLQRAAAFSDEYKKQTGSAALVFAEHTIEPALNMLVAEKPGDFLQPACFVFNRREEQYEALRKRFDIDAVGHINYFDAGSPEEVIKKCEEIKKRDDSRYSCFDSDYDRRKSELRKYAQFVAALALNEETRQLQQAIYDVLKRDLGDEFEKTLERERAYCLHMSAYEHKQRRMTDKFIARKRMILESGAPVVGEGTFDFDKYIPLMVQLHLENSS